MPYIVIIGPKRIGRSLVSRGKLLITGGLLVWIGMSGAVAVWAEPAIPEKQAEAPANAPATVEDYPGLPKEILSMSTAAGDPDFARLVSATRWAVEHAGWERHRGALEKALVAAMQGNWIESPENMERILTLKTPSVMLAQDTVLHAIDPSVMGKLAKDKDTKDFLIWLFTNPRAIGLLADTLKPADKPQRVLEIWRDCWKSDRDGAEKYTALALAVAVDFDEPVEIDPRFYGDWGDQSSSSSTARTPVYVDPVERYRFYRDADTRGMLKVDLSDLAPYELVWVVNAAVPSSELTWAEGHVQLGRQEWGRAYFSVRYRMDEVVGKAIYDRYTLAEILKNGGVCADQAYFASVTAKANGIPAMSIGGQDGGVAHAWIQWEVGRNQWSEAGNYGHDGGGTTDDPQTHRTWKEQELHEVTAPQRHSEGWAMTEGYLKLASLFADANQPDLARMALDAAIQLTPQDKDAWDRMLDTMEAAKVSTGEWEVEIARMRAEFEKYPDIIAEINDRETKYLASSGDPKVALAALARQTKRFLRMDGGRTDLFLDSTFRQADLTTAAGDTDETGCVYHDALLEKGQDNTAFRAIAQKYFDWAARAGKGGKALMDIDKTFERNFQPPYSDYFGLGAYDDALRMVITMYKQEGPVADQHRLERLADKVEDQLAYLRKQILRHPGH